MPLTRHYLRRLLATPSAVLWRALRGQLVDATTAVMDGALAAGYLTERLRSARGTGRSTASSAVRATPAVATGDQPDVLLTRSDQKEMGKAG